MSIVSLNPSSLNPMSSPAAPGGGRSQLEVAAEQFEALFLQQILKQMRKAGEVLAEGNPLNSRQMSSMRDFHDEVLAETLAGQKQAGIASLLVSQLSGGVGMDEQLAQAGLLASGAPVPARDPMLQPALARPVSLMQPLRDTWQRGVAELDSLWQRGRVGFEELVGRVIQQESAGNTQAVSPKGARGLMQLMPDTARDMARELGLAYDEARLLSDGDYNKRLGTAYLNKMLDRYDGHQALALAAYNAGPGRVDEWLQRHGDPRRGELSTQEWVERIPFAETREYTRKILRLEAASRQPEPLAVPVQAAFKSAPAAVALSLVTPLDFEHRARTEALARPIRPESQEIES